MRPPGEWITGRNWDQNLWPSRAFPTKASLDRTTPEHPVALVRIEVTPRGRTRPRSASAGIDRHTPDPSGGIIARDARGEITGLLIDTAQSLLQAVVPRPSDEQFDRAVRECIADCLATGLTGIHEMGAELYALASYRRLSSAASSRSGTTWRWRGARSRPGRTTASAARRASATMDG